jgi:L-alanine-DL-glutamate epimerase-like enolase superfamily enzyme
LDIADGMIRAPKGVGFGIEYDWDYIDNHTVATY